MAPVEVKVVEFPEHIVEVPLIFTVGVETTLIFVVRVPKQLNAVPVTV